ncbi:MAG: thioredoxin domain-containing protein [Bacilli bacterium]
MKKIRNSKEYIEEVEEYNDFVLLDFFATWCGPCQMLKPVLESVEDIIKVVQLDVDRYDIDYNFKIKSIPSLYIIKNNKIVNKTEGYQTEKELLNFIKESMNIEPEKYKDVPKKGEITKITNKIIKKIFK